MLFNSPQLIKEVEKKLPRKSPQNKLYSTKNKQTMQVWTIRSTYTVRLRLRLSRWEGRSLLAEKREIQRAETAKTVKYKKEGWMTFMTQSARDTAW